MNVKILNMEGLVQQPPLEGVFPVAKFRNELDRRLNNDVPISYPLSTCIEYGDSYNCTPKEMAISGIVVVIFIAWWVFMQTYASRHIE